MRRTVALLGMILILLMAGKMPARAQTAKVVPKGKIVLAWHAKWRPSGSIRRSMTGRRRPTTS